MQLFVYLIFDKVAHSFAAPFVQPNEACAIRFFNHAINANQNAEPSDFELFCLGVFDTSNGHLGDIVPVFVKSGEEVK